MLLRRHPPGIESRPEQTVAGLEHVPADSDAVLRWLAENRVEYVLVGPTARAIRGDAEARGPAAIVPAPYGRNLDRLSRALSAAHARRRIDVGSGGLTGADTGPFKLGPEKLVSGPRWTLRCGAYDLDIEKRGPGLPRYQDLLYEAWTFKLEPELKVQVGSIEHVELFERAARPDPAPEIRITRKGQAPIRP